MNDVLSTPLGQPVVCAGTVASSRGSLRATNVARRATSFTQPWKCISARIAS